MASDIALFSLDAGRDLAERVAGGSTLKRATEAFRGHGAAAVYAAVTHGLAGVARGCITACQAV